MRFLVVKSIQLSYFLPIIHVFTVHFLDDFLIKRVVALDKIGQIGELGERIEIFFISLLAIFA